MDHEEETDMDNSNKSPLKIPSVNGTDGGGALCKKWHVVYVKPNHERRDAQVIKKLGFETYVAIQKVWRQWSDRRKLIDKVVITQIVFIKCDIKEAERLERLSFILHFLRKPGTRDKATVRDDQIENLKIVLKNADESVTFSSNNFSKGDSVSIRFGKFKGVTGTVERIDEKSDFLTIALDFLGYAKVKIKAEDLKPIKAK